VADALSRKSSANLTTLTTEQHQLMENMRRLDLIMTIADAPSTSTPTDVAMAAPLTVQPTLRDEIPLTQPSDPLLAKYIASVT
jgi:hypothetical protein